MTDLALRRLIGLLALAGLGIAAYLTFIRYTNGTIACSTGGCELVQSSRYSAVAGVPVAVIGLVGYASILASTLIRGEPGAAIGAMLTFVGVAFAGYLIYVQAALIDAFCQWCLASDVIMGVLVLIAALRLRVALRDRAPG